MGQSCAIYPTVLNKKGEKVQSKLFKDMLAFSHNMRDEVVRCYNIIYTEKFQKEWLPKLELDMYGEPTLKSLLEKTNLADKLSITEASVQETLNRRIGYYSAKNPERPALWLDNQENVRKLQTKANNFNKNNPFRDKYVARVVSIQDWESYRVFKGVRVDRRDAMNSMEAKQMEYDENLFNRLVEILSSKGISIGALTELEERMGLHGVADFSKAKEAAEGMVELIRLAKGLEGRKALPEEFAHLVIRAMKGTNPVVGRLINYIEQNGLIEEVLGEDFEKYNQAYEQDRAKLAEEVAGKLLAKHLLNQEPIVKPYKNILQRVIEAFKRFFGILDESEIQRAMDTADAQFGEMAKEILHGDLMDQVDLKNMPADNDALYQISSTLSKEEETLRKIIDIENKRWAVYKARTVNPGFDAAQASYIQELEESLANHTEVEGIYKALSHISKGLQDINARFEKLSRESSTLNAKAGVLRDIRNYIKSYENLLSEIEELLDEEELEMSEEKREQLDTLMTQVTREVKKSSIKLDKHTMPSFTAFVNSFIGDKAFTYKGQEYTIEELIKGKKIIGEDGKERTIHAEDISFVDRWLDSMADSAHPLLRVFDKIVKQYKNKARLETVQFINERIKTAGIKLEQAGIKNQDWMFAKDAEGKRTGKYITKIDKKRYFLEKEAFKKTLEERYGEHPVGEAERAYRRELRNWYIAHTKPSETEGGKREINDDYITPEYAALNAAQRDFYEEMMSCKAELEKNFPEGTTSLYNTIKIRKDLVERIKSSGGAKKGVTEIWEDIKDGWIRRSDDTEFSTSRGIKDFEGREVMKLPIYYTSLGENESEEDVSTDVVSTMAAYAAMAIEYNNMNESINILELGHDIVNDKLVTSKTRAGKRMVEKLKGASGEEIISEITETENNVKARLNDFFSMQIYNRYMKDEGTIFNTQIDRGKAANKINSLSSIMSMAGNILLGISNVATGSAMMRIETLSGQFFKAKDKVKADGIYTAELPKYLSEIGSRVKTSKLALWDELFDVEQDYDQEVKDIRFNRKNAFSRALSTNTLFFLTNSGEHWMQNRTSLALANAYKLKDASGKEISLWDAMEVVPIDPNNSSLGGRLQLKEGVTKLDGSEFTQADIIAFSRKTTAINERMHGIYNKADKSAFQATGIGRMVMMYRKYIVPSLNRRFEARKENLDLGEESEGYYRTFARFMIQLAKDVKHADVHIAGRWNELNDMEKANMKRAAVEVIQYLALCAIIALFARMKGDDDDEDQSWISKMTEYQLYRLKTELGVLIPGVSMVNESLKILKSPMAAMNTMQSIVNLTKVLNPWNYETIGGEDAMIQSGQFKGHSKAYKAFMSSPLVPMRNTFIRGVNPELAIPFFKTGN